jgi:(1->4)-alpha-D-glucan 1-alpha-D-glucosylmutase
LLAAVAQSETSRLLEDWRDGGIKLAVMVRLLRFRARYALLFSAGDYRPVAARGTFGENLVAFTRNHEAKSVLVVVPRLTAELGAPPLGLVWDDTQLLQEARATTRWRDVLTQRMYSAKEPLFLRALFAELPFAVLESS